MQRREFLKGIAAATAVSVLGPKLRSVDAARTPPKLNVLFVLADQWRHQAFAHQGDPNLKTPNMDLLATQGSRWQRCYATNPVCTPNRSCLLTGQFSHQTGMVHNDLMMPPDTRSVAESFVDAGYATHYIGKWHMDGPTTPGFVPPGWRRRGFQTFEGFNSGHYYPTGAHYFTDDGKLLWPNVYEPVYQTDLAIEFMKKKQADSKPFFCYLSWGPPHMPYKPPREWDRFDPKSLQWRPNVPEYEKERPGTRKSLAGYYGLCESLDHEMGRLMKFLDEAGLADNTLLVFNSDHGDMHGSHGLHFKSKPEDESLHVPLFMRFPGKIAAGQKPETLISTVDIMPSILSMCGLKPIPTAFGVDKSAAVLGGKVDCDSVYSMGCIRHSGTVPASEEAGAQPASKPVVPENNPAISIYYDPPEWRCLVTDTHKLIVKKDNTHGLFDLVKDPYEMTNLWDNPQMASLQNKLLDRMKQWQKETGDVFPAESRPAKASYDKA
jgi:arylsulfatase A-like enzyme